MLNGALISVTLLILLGLTASFFFTVIIPKSTDEAFSNFASAGGFYFIAGTYSMMLLLSMWALVRTYTVGPGYTKDHFKSCKLEDPKACNHDHATPREDFQQSFTQRSQEAGGLRHSDDASDVNSSHIGDFSEQDRGMTYTIYTKEDHAALSVSSQTARNYEANGENEPLILPMEIEEADNKALATVSVAKYHTTD